MNASGKRIVLLLQHLFFKKPITNLLLLLNLYDSEGLLLSRSLAYSQKALPQGQPILFESEYFVVDFSHVRVYVEYTDAQRARKKEFIASYHKSKI